MIYQEHARRKLRQAFDAILKQFSSNGNRQSMLSANRSFQAQSSTCSTLLQTMLLYETCIVLSRKCLSDVNKDFSHQWRNLMITTLSARTIYRQIPVSYLQIWYFHRNGRETFHGCCGFVLLPRKGHFPRKISEHSQNYNITKIVILII